MLESFVFCSLSLYWGKNREMADVYVGILDTYKGTRVRFIPQMCLYRSSDAYH